MKFNEQSLPALRGTEAQVRWAVSIRREALKLKWPVEAADLLLQVNDSTWWIANRSEFQTLEYKQPAPSQLVSGGGQLEFPEPGARVKLDEAEWSNLLRKVNDPTRSIVDREAAVGARVNDAAEWAKSVSRHPLTAEAAILAVLSRLYHDPVKSQLVSKARAAVQAANFEVERDLDAIRRILRD